jgi:hypothetical protein
MVGVRVTNRNLKRAVRARMAETGENYTRALRVLQEERAGSYLEHGPGRWPAAQSDVIPLLRSEGWVLWAGAEPREGDGTRHKHEVPDEPVPREVVHRHARGAEPHDHRPG